MKRLLSFLFPLLLTFSLVSCGLVGKKTDSSAIAALEKDETETSALTLSKEDREWFAEQMISVSSSGEVSSATATGLELRIIWSFVKETGKAEAVLTAEFWLDYRAPFDSHGARTLTYSVAGESGSCCCPSVSETSGSHSVLLTSVPVSLSYSEAVDRSFTVSAVYDYSGTYQTVGWYGNETEVTIDSLSVSALAVLRDYSTLPEKETLSVENIMQTPELPNGCEITSLTILVNYLGFDVDKLTMSDLYLPKNEDTYSSDFYQTFAGNPRNQKRSFGCYAPVIVQSAKNFLADYDKSGTYQPTNLSGSSPEELYRQVSLGNPVVVWMTQYIDSTPAILKTWTSSEGKAMNWKHPLHCVVLIGYDMNAKTVTIADPLVGIVTHPMETFELRYLQLGSQAVIVTK